MTHIFDILTYGACPDGKTLNTEAIQAAINACHRAGGRVLCGPGSFLTGSLELRSNVVHRQGGHILTACCPKASRAHHSRCTNVG
ncbi:hypothetical protein ACFLSJ_08220 [Verrucomicrobiota bacterium]